jgi:hypothetical protein
MQVDRHDEAFLKKKELVVTFRNLANVPKNGSSKKQDRNMWTEFVWLKAYKVAGSFERSNKPAGFITCRVCLYWLSNC